MNDENLDSQEVSPADQALIEDSIDYEDFSSRVYKFIFFKGYSLSEWSQILSMPEVNCSEDISPAELDLLNQKFLNISNIVTENLAEATVILGSAETSHTIEMLRVKESVEEELIRNSPFKKAPTVKDKEDACLLACINTYRRLKRAEAVVSFWTQHSYKLKNLDGRLISLSRSKFI